MSRRLVSSLSLFASLALPLTLVDACSSDSSKPRDQVDERDASTNQRDAGNDDTNDADTVFDSGFEPIVDKLTNAGATCSENSECTGESDANRCLLDVIGLSFPGGYCSTTCIADSECGADSRCPLAPLFENAQLLALIGPLASQITELSTCLKTCESADDCRVDEGYRCASADEAIQGAGDFGVDLSVRYCVPPTDALIPDAGPDGGADDAATDADAGDAGPDDDAGDAGDGDAGTDTDAGDAGDSDAQPST